VSVVDALAEGGPVDRLARYFEYWLLRLQGVYPSLAACHRCAADLAGGARLPPGDPVLVCRRCGTSTGGTGLSADAMAFLRGGAALPPGRLDVLALSRRADRELERAHQALIALHLEKELRSTRVLREMREEPPTGASRSPITRYRPPAAAHRPPT
jgi:recombinational DNA repair protein (RecF pathway)